jgi:hypothetical protein
MKKNKRGGRGARLIAQMLDPILPGQERQQEPEADVLPPEGADELDEALPAPTEEPQPGELEDEVMADS